MKYFPLVLMGLMACGPVSPDPPGKEDADEDIGSMTIGHAFGESFRPLEDGAELPLVAGIQGGYHVEVALSVEDMPARIDVHRETRRFEDGALVARTWFRSNVKPDGRLDFEVPVFLCPAPVGLSIADETLEVIYRVEEIESRVAFVPRCPEGDMFCDESCRR